jgi:hypothetical protein
MEKYQQHGLTREEDNVLGAFGTDQREVKLDQFDLSTQEVSKVHDAARTLRSKGFLSISTNKFGEEVYALTPKGLALWKIRFKEEEA